jgi:hypothetical protein
MSRSKSDEWEKVSSMFLSAPLFPIPSLVDKFGTCSAYNFDKDNSGDRGLDHESLPSFGSSPLFPRIHFATVAAPVL